VIPDLGTLFSQAYWFEHASSIKNGLLLVSFTLVALWETFQPRKHLATPTGRRWANNTAITLLFATPTTLVARISTIFVALAVAHSRYGLLNREAVPFWIRCVLAVLALDLFRYGFHYLFHSTPALWRLHQLHHSDPDFDWSTGFLFHPVEFALAAAAYLGFIALIAPPAIAVLGLEIAIVTQNFFVHANGRVPRWLDSALRRVVVTPDMHRVHHSDEFAEQNANFGDVFPWWDWIFGTYQAQPAAGHERMGIGLRELALDRGLNLWEMLALPFRKQASVVATSPAARIEAPVTNTSVQVSSQAGTKH
jgi:sterol desaturase/sphingolipid hydroxylase (fatty acid hydroxylase superfamily)